MGVNNFWNNNYVEYKSNGDRNKTLTFLTKLLTKEMQQSYENAKICGICKEKFENKFLKDEKYLKLRDHYHYSAEYEGALHPHRICNLKYYVPKKIL